MARIPKTGVESPNFQASIFYDDEWEEFIVKFYRVEPVEGSQPALHYMGEDADAHEDDYDAAIGTAKAALAHYESRRTP